MTLRPRVTVVDHYDSFTHNLVHALERAGASCDVVFHDRATVDELLGVDGLVLSAGPCSPRETAVTLPLLHTLLESGGPPLFGVCLGHQCIAHALGAEVRRAKRPMHGKATRVRHDDRGLFAGCPNPSAFARYNSLSVYALPDALEACAWDDDGELMALRHRRLPLEGVQFHPESHLSDHGAQLFRNWVTTLPVGAGLQTPAG